MKLFTKTLIAVILLLITATFANRYQASIKEFETDVELKEYTVRRYIDLSSGYMDLMSIYGNHYLQNEFENAKLYSYLEYDGKRGGYHLDVIGGTLFQEQAGNLTGKGDVPTNGMALREINLALELNAYFVKIREQIPNVAWIYYTSESGFINAFPWVSSEEVFYDDDILKANFFTYATLYLNPDRKTIWTPVYEDLGGKGLMVTCSCPIYYKNDFLGVISLDLTSAYLSEVMESDYEGYLVDQTGVLIASGNHMVSGEEKQYLESTMNFSYPDWKEVRSLPIGETKLISGYYISVAKFENAPWKMYFRVPVWKILMQSFMATVPMLMICLFFLYSIYEIERRKRTEKLLSKTLQERKEYQTLLEDAAKRDFLTQTLNRRGMKLKLNDLTEQEDNKTFYVVMGDLDNFKALNDTFGHDAGDKILVEVADVLKKDIAPEDLVCRWGGEEFLFVLSDMNMEEITQIAEKVRKDIEEIKIPWGEMELKTTITLGVAQYQPPMQVYECISYADQALYEGKRNGRNQVVIHNPATV